MAFRSSYVVIEVAAEVDRQQADIDRVFIGVGIAVAYACQPQHGIRALDDLAHGARDGRLDLLDIDRASKAHIVHHRACQRTGLGLQPGRLQVVAFPGWSFRRGPHGRRGWIHQGAIDWGYPFVLVVFDDHFAAVLRDFGDLVDVLDQESLEQEWGFDPWPIEFDDPHADAQGRDLNAFTAYSRLEIPRPCPNHHRQIDSPANNMSALLQYRQARRRFPKRINPL